MKIIGCLPIKILGINTNNIQRGLECRDAIARLVRAAKRRGWKGKAAFSFVLFQASR